MFKLYPYQETAVKKIFNHLRLFPGDHPIVALPTGSGKSPVLAELAKQAIQWKAHTLVVSHDLRIIQQDAAAIEKHTGQDVGIYSAGAGRKEIKPITVAQIQSSFRKPELFNKFKLIIVDECHLIPGSDTSMYRQLLSGLNPNAKIVGLTATPYRLGSGPIYGSEGSIFNSLVYDLTDGDNFVNLIRDGYLSNIRAIAPKYELSDKGLHTQAGDFIDSEMSLAFDKESITESIVNEIIPYAKQRKKTLIFAIDIAHAEHIAECLIRGGVDAYVVHSKMEEDSAEVIEKFRSGKRRCIVNVNMLTTGFDDPEIDLICMLKLTKSPVRHVQSIGRGLRVAPGKKDCWVLDFAGNTNRLGPINKIDVKVKQKVKGDGEAPTKTCPECNTIAHLSAKECSYCGYKFPVSCGLSTESYNGSIVADSRPDTQEVTGVEYRILNKSNSPPMLMVTYVCGFRTFTKPVCPEHSGYAKYYARQWVQDAGMALTDSELAQAKVSVEYLNAIKDRLLVPEKILVEESGKYPNIIKIFYGPN